MSNEPSIADLKSAFAAQLSTLPPPAEGRHEHYRPRTRSRTVATAGAAFIVVAAVASAAVAFTGRDRGFTTVAAAPPATATLSIVDIAGTSVTLPSGVRPADSDEDGCFPQFVRSDGASGPPPGIAGWATVVWSEDGSPIDCLLVQSDTGIMSPPASAEPTMVAGLAAWTWRVDDPWGTGEAHIYFVEIPRGGDRPAVPLLVIVAGSAVPDVPEIVEEILHQL